MTGRALALLAAAEEHAATDDELAALSIGRRDALLLALRTRLFGDRMVALATCASCGESLELDFSGTDITHPSSQGTDPRVNGPVTLHTDGFELRLRLLDSRDLESITGEADLGTSRDVLLRRCVLGAHRGEVEVAVAHLPAEVLDAVDEWLAATDPQADVQVELRCPGCAATWQQGFDIVGFFWAEVDAWARRTLYEVHRLAAAYGWREGDILAMSAPRRQAYLDLVGS
ncbi:hypothetical protein ACH492_05085 [Streptomyces sp. NPDC019443]|uniref:T4 family baseplate hub assembly chaperone n=1 Tax=Streptomyces sp. NPDC019443 TaxID=3365061 RepID=UPI0037894A6D